jgi:trk system potassium uptake protein TrkH
LIILGGLGFAVIWEILRYPRSHLLSVNSKIVLATTFILLATGFLGILLLESGNSLTLGSLGLKDKIVNAMFFSVTPRTAGFATLNVGAMSQASMFLIVLLMAIGASPGSTGGGIKTTTFATVVSARLADVRNKRYPVMFRRRIDIETVARADTIFVLYITLIAISSMILTVSEGTQFMNALLEVVSAAATVGLTTGITPDLSAIGKLTIILTMYSGRVGPLTLAFAVAKSGRQLYDYPKEELILS